MYPLWASKSLLIPVCTLIVLIKLAIDHLLPGTQYKDKRVLWGGGVNGNDYNYSFSTVAVM